MATPIYLLQIHLASTFVGSIHSSADIPLVSTAPSELPALPELLVTVLTNGEVTRLSFAEILCTVKMLWPDEEGAHVSALVSQLLSEWVQKGVVDLADDAHYSVENSALLRAELAVAGDLPTA